MMDEEATLTEIQSIRQKMVEAYHIQRQYKTILDVISGERIGYESQLTDLEKSTADSKLEASKLKVSLYVSYNIFTIIQHRPIHIRPFYCELFAAPLSCQSPKNKNKNDRVSLLVPRI